MTICIIGSLWPVFIVMNAVLVESTSECVRTSEYSSGRDELVCAQVVYRHGNRSIINTYPNDPYQGEKWWPNGEGELTNVREHLNKTTISSRILSINKITCSMVKFINMSLVNFSVDDIRR